MPDIIADNVHRTSITTKLTMAASKSKRFDKLCKTTKAVFQPKQWKIGYFKSPRSSESSAEQATLQLSPASQEATAYVLPLPQASSVSFEDSCRESFNEVVKNSHNTSGVKIVITGPCTIVEGSSKARTTYPIPVPKSMPQDSFDLVRTPKPDPPASRLKEGSAPEPESMSDIVIKTMALVSNDPRGKALMDAGQAYLRAAEAAEPYRGRDLVVCFEEQRERESVGVETIRETMRTIPVTQLTTIQELRYLLQREAVRLLDNASIMPGEIFGSIFLVLMGSPSVLKTDDWDRMRTELPSEDMSLRFSFQVRKLEHSEES